MADKAVKKSRKRTQVSVSGGMTEIIPEENDSVDEDPAAPEEAAEETAAVPETEPEEIAEIRRKVLRFPVTTIRSKDR